MIEGINNRYESLMLHNYQNMPIVKDTIKKLNINENNIKQTVFNSINDLFILLNDGTLYINDKIFDTNVREINTFYNYIIVYNDNSYLYYYSIFYDFKRFFTAKKIISYQHAFINLTNDNCLSITTSFVSDTNIYDELNNDYFFPLYIDNVYDVELGFKNDTENYLIITNNNRKMFFPLNIFCYKAGNWM